MAPKSPYLHAGSGLNSIVGGIFVGNGFDSATGSWETWGYIRCTREKRTVLKSDNETHYATLSGMIKVALVWTSWTPWTEVCSLKSDACDMT